MHIQLNVPKVTRIWWPMRVFQQDLNDAAKGKIVTLGFGKKCIVTVRQGGLNGSLPTTIFSSLTHHEAYWRKSVMELIQTHLINTHVIEELSESRQDQFLTAMLDKHGIESKPIDVFNLFRRELAELQDAGEKHPDVNYD